MQVSYGEEISIVRIMRPISPVRRRMMEKLDSIRLSVLGSMDESKRDGMIYGDLAILY